MLIIHHLLFSSIIINFIGSGVIVNRQGNTYTILTNWYGILHSIGKVIMTSDNQPHEVGKCILDNLNTLD